MIDKLIYREDGDGYLKGGYYHLFVLPAEGGSPRQLTFGPYDHEDPPAWSGDGKFLFISANRHEDRDFGPLNSEIFEVKVASGSVRALTDRFGPDCGPSLSPDGRLIAYQGFDDRHQGFQVSRLYVMNRSDGESRPLTTKLDRDIGGYSWSADSKGSSSNIPTRVTARSVTRAWTVTRACSRGTWAALQWGGPMRAARFRSPQRQLRLYLLHARPSRGCRRGWWPYRPGTPPDPPQRGPSGSQGVGRHRGDLVQVLLRRSRHPGMDRQAARFRCGQKTPAFVGNPWRAFTDYGDRFAAEIKLYAAAGYVVLYTNPRGSTSYGETFGNLTHHNYPGQDYDDLMTGVDAVIAKGYIDDEQLYVTGGSGGGVLASWIVGKTNRFRAAVVAKPVTNWYSFALTSDNYTYYYKYWFPGPPWEHAEHYLKRSSLSLVGNVTTPTMLLTGESDYRTPISESEQYYQALKLRKIDTMLVRVPGASHGIAGKPSRLIAKVLHILKWFEIHADYSPWAPRREKWGEHMRVVAGNCASPR